MFEKATLFSAIFVFISFGMVGLKYFDFVETKNQVTKTSMNNELPIINQSI